MELTVAGLVNLIRILNNALVQTLTTNIDDLETKMEQLEAETSTQREILLNQQVLMTQIMIKLQMLLTIPSREYLYGS